MKWRRRASTVFAALLAVAVMLQTMPGGRADSLCDTPQCHCDDTQSEVKCSCRNAPHEPQEIVLKAQGPGRVPRVATSVSVTDCDRVTVMPMAFDDAKSLWTVDIGSVQRLEVSERAFSWSEVTTPGVQHHHQGLAVTVTNATVPELPSYAFRGRLRSITFARVRLDSVKPFAFSSLHGTTGRIEFRETAFGLIEQQAFKKFTVKDFVLKASSFEQPAPSRMLTEITVTDELRVEDVEFALIRTYAFKVHGPKVFRVQNCRAACVQSTAFDVTCRGPAFVEDNWFERLERGAFAAVSVDSRKVSEEDFQEFVFENNTVAEFEDDALVFDTRGFRPRLDWLIVGKACDCSTRWRDNLVAFSLDYPHKTTRPSLLVEQVAWCWSTDTGERRQIKAKQYGEANCAGGIAGARSGGMGALHMTMLAVVAVATLTAALVCWSWYRKRRRSQWINVPGSSPLKTRSILKNRAGSGSGDKRRHMMVMPEGKTYRETELHVIVESAGSADGLYRSSASSFNQRIQPLTSDL
ncbi:uncharacterized protein LOC126834903 [Adelges cooleyi]|uniref:uncharacterized protein LOC126834903 n=1 Tax=Adelges cooleyi TaxID=133065 RepID=UPI0021808B9B|nr:uncharacterized protein LOC126834903 [Adelges cooleyi]XP_050423074.1 uncharacterized protein LOC126834903 [Adelges cooleyi]